LWHVERRQDSHRRRLASAIRTDEAEHLAAPHAERHVIHRVDIVEMTDEAVDLEDWLAHGVPMCPSTRWKLERSSIPRTPPSTNGERSMTGEVGLIRELRHHVVKY
jgi:hypothetical protein